MKKVHYLFILVAIVLSTGCGKINLLSLEQEKQLGLQSRDQILQEYGSKVLNPNSTDPKVKAAYDYIKNVRNECLNSGLVRYKDEFAWEVYIIKDPTLNAFCTPGGYIFFYTGLIDYLEDGSSLAGVMGHEIAHADLRHSGKQITTQMGLDILLSIVAGTAGQQIAQVTGLLTTLGALKYSRGFESESDAASVKYLCGSSFQTDGASRFFEKLVAENNPSQPAIFSTHPDPGDRVNNIKTLASQAQGCIPVSSKKQYKNDPEYEQFQRNCR